jgi:very-short-patch-repair endonuclease
MVRRRSADSATGSDAAGADRNAPEATGEFDSSEQLIAKGHRRARISAGRSLTSRARSMPSVDVEHSSIKDDWCDPRWKEVCLALLRLQHEITRSAGEHQTLRFRLTSYSSHNNYRIHLSSGATAREELFPHSAFSLDEFNFVFRLFHEWLSGNELKAIIEFTCSHPEGIMVCSRCSCYGPSGSAGVCAECGREISDELRKSAETGQLPRLVEVFGDELRALGFVAEKPLGNYRVDFLHDDARLAVELDGPFHESRVKSGADKVRDRMLLLDHGVTTIRYRYRELLEARQTCLDQVKKLLRKRL